jgi:hypothetical protein
MDAIRSRAANALFRNGIIIKRYENYRLAATEIDTDRLRTITEEEVRHFRSVGEQTLPIVMQYIKQLKEIFKL